MSRCGENPMNAICLGLARNNSGSKCSSDFNRKTMSMFMDEQFQNDFSSAEVSSHSEEAGHIGSCNRNNGSYTSRFQLEKEIQILQQQLKEEVELHAILENAIERNAIKLSNTSYLPHHAKELLSNIAILEVTVSKLQQEMVSMHFQLSQERNERRLAAYRRKHSPSQDPSSLKCSKYSSPTISHSSEGNSCKELGDAPSEASSKSMDSSVEDAVDSVVNISERKLSSIKDTETCQPVKFVKLCKGVPHKGLWEHPNQLSEEMVRCMKNIFISLSDSTTPPKSPLLESQCPSVSPRGHLSNSFLWSLSERSVISSWVSSPRVNLQCSSELLTSEGVCDPYRVRGKLSWAEIGNYGLTIEVSWMSVGKKQLEYAAGALRKFRTLVEQLAKVNPIHLSGNERLAFWMNLYNALIMHAYLAYGVPRSDLKLFSLMQKAAYTVGGHSLSAAAIEFAILKTKPPVHRPQIALLLALHKLKVSEEQKKFAIDTPEPLVAFALSCGMHSSPAVRIYTAKNVKEELQEAQHDFVRASVGVSSKGKLLVPKMLHCFARGFVDDANLAVWISRYLPPHQAAFVEQCMSQRRQSLLGSRNCGILPFDSRFRYLFVPDKITSR